MLSILKAAFYEPIYNILVFLIDIVPAHNVGFSIILTTVFVKALILPLSHKATRAQLKLREIEPEVAKIRELEKDRQKQTVALLELYKKNNINPFTGILVFIIQIPIIISLYLIFANSGLPTINQELLYSFVPRPTDVNMMFFGFDMAGKSLILAVLAGLTQFIQAWLLIPSGAVTPTKTEGTPSFRDEFMKSMNLQMKYVFPIIVGVIAYQFSAAVALYWVVGNIFTIGQELFTKGTLKRS